jgi:tRNA threonylcarbamoyladenosine biosynthesis protein TsaE
MITSISKSEAETQKIGKDFANNLKPGSIAALFGELGSGKTQFIKGICKGLGVKEIVNSPTFIIINEYYTENFGKLYHFDLFRMKTTEEILNLGFEEYLSSNGILLIEWPELIENILPDNTIKIYLSHMSNHENMREIKIAGN